MTTSSCAWIGCYCTGAGSVGSPRKIDPLGLLLGPPGPNSARQSAVASPCRRIASGWRHLPAVRGPPAALVSFAGPLPAVSRPFPGRFATFFLGNTFAAIALQGWPPSSRGCEGLPGPLAPRLARSLKTALQHLCRSQAPLRPVATKWRSACRLSLTPDARPIRFSSGVPSPSRLPIAPAGSGPPRGLFNCRIVGIVSPVVGRTHFAACSPLAGYRCNEQRTLSKGLSATP
jgi:hypothetical protein